LMTHPERDAGSALGRDKRVELQKAFFYIRRAYDRNCWGVYRGAGRDRKIAAQKSS
jgi:hypothetical protein